MKIIALIAVVPDKKSMLRDKFSQRLEVHVTKRSYVKRLE